MLSPKLSLALTIGVLFFFIEAPERCFGNAPVKIGPMYQCDHEVRGVVYEIHEQQIMIVDFSYDAKGPATYIHGQLKGSPAISSEGDNFVTLSNPNGKCDRVTPDMPFKYQNITLNLPRSIKEFETIGLLCYQYCNNFGHIYIPKDKNYPPVPPDFVKPEDCNKPTYDACPIKKVKHGAIQSKCLASEARGEGEQEKSSAIIPYVNKALVGLSLGLLLKANN